MSDRYLRAAEMARAERLDALEAEIERLRDTVRDLLDELADQGVDTVYHPARAVLDD
ncbi:MAG: hypothetical protein ABR592_00275 [Nitriliruptorales bacterium]